MNSAIGINMVQIQCLASLYLFMLCSYKISLLGNCCRLSMSEKALSTSLRANVSSVPSAAVNKYDLSSSLIPLIAEGQTTSEVIVSVIPSDYLVNAGLNLVCVVDVSGT